MHGPLVGPFRLAEPIGQGGMGVVWRATHRSGTEVAIKLLRADLARKPGFVDAFESEVRAVAALHHPHVVYVHDYGSVPDDVSQELEAGGRYLAMELAQGSLRSRLPRNWAELNTLLGQLLSALAHAHSAGVIHRDIKMGNLLLVGDGLDLRLSDFGLAHAYDMATGEDAAVGGGTPTYMAPEQFGGGDGEQGTWTDLYAVGVVAFALAGGEPPFRGADMAALARAHILDEVPRLRPRFPVPPGFEDWLGQLLEKSPEHRLHYAADAKWVLSRLGEPRDSKPYSARPAAPTSTRPESSRPTLLEGSSEASERSTRLHEVARRAESRTTQPRGRSTVPPSFHPPRPVTPRQHPPIEVDWRDPERDRSHLLGAGLSLYGLRPVPIVDRVAERETLWSALRDGATRMRPKVVVLRGASGSGKSALARWLARRAHERGAAHVLRAVHSPFPAATDGLRAMLARHLRVTATPRSRVEDRIGSMLRVLGVLDPDEVSALAELARPSTEAEFLADERRIRFGSARERHVTLGRFLARRAEERPALLWIDDAQWAADALGFVEYLLEDSSVRLPSLVLLTVQNEGLAERDHERRLVEGLLERPEVLELSMGPLPERFRGELVERLLGLEPQLGARVLERTAGNPMFAVQLVGDWVQRGLLEVGERGFRLAEGVALELPSSIRDVWAQRVRQLLRGRPDSWALGLSLAAVLGQEVDASRWERVCRQAGVNPPSGLAAELEKRGLAERRTDGLGWSWAHGMLRETVEELARKEGRLPFLHLACAKELEARPLEAFARGRLGRHLVGAQRHREALVHLLEGAKEVEADGGDYHTAELLLREREAALDRLSVPDDDPRRAVGWLQLASVMNGASRTEEGRTWATRVLDGPASWGEHKAAAALELAWPHLIAGRLDEAERCCERAAEHLGEADVPRLRGWLAHHLGWLRIYRGEHDRAVDTLTESIAHYERAGETVKVADSWIGLAYAESEASMGGVEEHADRGLRCAQESGARRLQGRALLLRADLARTQGRYADAEMDFWEVARLMEQLGSPEALWARAYLGFTRVEADRAHEARAILEECLPESDPPMHHALRARIQLALLSCVDPESELPLFREHLRSARDFVESSGIVYGDIVRLARRAARVAREATLPDEAAACEAIARSVEERISKD